ncbi:MAG: DUF6456 domain-containing protein [Sulfitobacter sp.]
MQNYIDHTEMGVPIRALARQQGCHASTIMRQIRRVETLRDDPLVDGVLKTLGGIAEPHADEKQQVNTAQPLPGVVELSEHGIRVLRRLCETGAVLAVAKDMEKAVIVRDCVTGENARTGVVDRAIAEAMALKGWIAAPSSGRITRYQITAAGRAALADMMARDESLRARGSYDANATSEDDTPRRIRYGLAESPLAALARRRDRDGEHFLSSDLVGAGERLREDFEMAQMGADVAGNWDGFLATLNSERAPVHAGRARAAHEAHDRVIAALQDLGVGLSDVTLRCCCFLEGLETAEKMLGWSARSGKIVLRIALIRLKEHYARTGKSDGRMIG